MPYVRSRYYREEEKPAGYRRVEAGFGLLEKNTLFHQLDGYITAKPSHLNAKGSLACVTKDGDIYVNMRANLSPEQWCYVMAHNLLHLAFGHFDKASIPSDCEFVPALWNKACDIYITRFLYDIRLGEPICADPAEAYPIKLNSEQKIYEYLLKHQDNGAQICGTNSEKLKDMIGVERPIVYKKGERKHMLKNFPMQSLILSNLHSAMREDTILKRKRIPSFPEQQNGSCPIIRYSEVLRLHLKLWRTLNCAIGMKSTLPRLTQSRESFMPIRRADFRRKSGFLFSRMNISMPDCSTRNGAMGVISFCGTSPATTSSTTGCTKWRSAECRRMGCCMMKHFTINRQKVSMI